MPFKKGQVTNPGGRPKGEPSKKTIMIREMRDKLLEGSDEFITVMREEAFDKREPFALKYIADILNLPKLQLAKLDIPENSNIDDIQKAFLNAISSMKEISYEDAINGLKIVQVIKSNTLVEKVIDPEIQALSDEQLIKINEIMKGKADGF